MGMVSISYSVTDLSADQRHAFEGVLGQPLRDDQRVVVQLVDARGLTPPAEPKPLRDSTVTLKREGDVGILPDWCAIFADLSDEEFAEIEAAILTRADLGRSFDLDE
jgi:hypothetical protein